MTNSIKKILITATTLVLLALMVVLCVFPFSAGNKSDPFVKNAAIDLGTTAPEANKGTVRRFDGQMLSPRANEAEDSLKDDEYTYPNSQTIKRKHIYKDKDDNKLYYTDNEGVKHEAFEINTLATYNAFMNGNGKNYGMLSADINFGSSNMTTRVFANGRVLDGNGYSIKLKANTGDNSFYTGNDISSNALYAEQSSWSVNYSAGGYITAVNRGTIKNVTVEFDSSMIMKTDYANYSATSSGTNQFATHASTADKVIAIGIFAGINFGTFENVCLDMQGAFNFVKKQNPSSDLQNNILYMGGMIGIQAGGSTLTRATLNMAEEEDGIAGYVTTGGTQVMCFVAGMIATIITVPNASTGGVPKVCFLSISGKATIMAKTTAGGNTDDYVAVGLLGGTERYILSGESGSGNGDKYVNNQWVVEKLNGLQVYGIISSWSGACLEESTGVETPVRGLLFGRLGTTNLAKDTGLMPLVNNCPKGTTVAHSQNSPVKSIMLLWDYQNNKDITGYRAWSLDKRDAGSVTGWNTFIPNALESEKGTVTASFDYNATYDSGSVYGIAYGENFFENNKDKLTGLQIYDKEQTLSNILGKSIAVEDGYKGGIVWEAASRTLMNWDNTTAAPANNSIVASYTNQYGFFKQKGVNAGKAKYVVDFGESVAVEYANSTESGSSRDYDPDRAIALPKIKVVSGLKVPDNTFFTTYNAELAKKTPAELIASRLCDFRVKYSIDNQEWFLLSTGKGSTYNSNVGKTILPGKYSISCYLDPTRTDSNNVKLDKEFAFIDPIKKLLAPKDDSLKTAYTYSLNQRTINMSGSSDTTEVLREYIAKLQVTGQIKTNFLDGIDVTIGSTTPIAMDTSKHENGRYEYIYKGSTDDKGQSFIFAAYKNFINPVTGKVIKVAIAPNVTVLGVRIDTKAPEVSYRVFDKAKGEEGRKEITGSDLESLISNNGKNIWRNSKVWVEFTAIDKEAGFALPPGSTETSYPTVKTTTVIFGDNAKIDTPFADRFGNSTTISLKLNIDTVDTSITSDTVVNDFYYSDLSEESTRNGLVKNTSLGASIKVKVSVGIAGAKLYVSRQTTKEKVVWEEARFRIGAPADVHTLNVPGTMNGAEQTLTLDKDTGFKKVYIRIKLVSNIVKKDSSGNEYNPILYANEVGKKVTETSIDSSSDGTQPNKESNYFNFTYVSGGMPIYGRVFILQYQRYNVYLKTTDIKINDAQLTDEQVNNRDYMFDLLKKQYDGTTSFTLKYALNLTRSGACVKTADGASYPDLTNAELNSVITIEGRFNTSNVGLAEFSITAKSNNNLLASKNVHANDIDVMFSTDGAASGVGDRASTFDTHIERRELTIDMNAMPDFDKETGFGFSKTYTFGDTIPSKFKYFCPETKETLNIDIAISPKEGTEKSRTSLLNKGDYNISSLVVSGVSNINSSLDNYVITAQEYAEDGTTPQPDSGKFGKVTIKPFEAGVTVLFNDVIDGKVNFGFDGLFRKVTGFYIDVHKVEQGRYSFDKNGVAIPPSVTIQFYKTDPTNNPDAEKIDLTGFREIGTYYVIITIIDTNYIVSHDNQSIYTFRVDPGTLPVVIENNVANAESQKVANPSVVSYTSRVQEYEVKFAWKDGYNPYALDANGKKIITVDTNGDGQFDDKDIVIDPITGADTTEYKKIFDVKDITKKYYKYGLVEKKTLAGKTTWKLDQLVQNVEVNAKDICKTGAYRVEVGYPGNEFFRAATYEIDFIIDQAVVDIKVENPNLKLTYTGGKLHFDMYDANVSVFLPNVIETVYDADGKETNKKAPLELFKLSKKVVDEVSSDQITYGYNLESDKLKDLLSTLKLQRNSDGTWIDVQTYKDGKFVVDPAELGLGGATNVGASGIYYRIVINNDLNNKLFLSSEESAISLNIINRVFTFAEQRDEVSADVHTTYDERDHTIGLKAGIDDGERKIEYFTNNENDTLLTPNLFREAGEHRINVKISCANYDTVIFTYNVKIDKSIISTDDFSISNAIEEVYNGKEHTPKLNGTTFNAETGLYYYRGTVLTFSTVALPFLVNVGTLTGTFKIHSNNYQDFAHDFIISIVPMPVAVEYTQLKGFTPSTKFGSLEKYATYKNASGVSVFTSVEFYDENELKITFDEKKNTLSSGNYTARPVMDPNYVATPETSVMNFEIKVQGSMLGIIVGCTVGGVVLLGGGVALTVILLLKKKKATQV